MTDGRFYYTADGKVMKAFGADDSDALSLLQPHLQIRFVSGDARGFAISRSRIVDDMKYPLDLVSTTQRIQWIKERFDPETVIYMGDGIFDHLVLRTVGYGIAPADADPRAQKHANFVTKRRGGERAVAEACMHLLELFFKSHHALDMIPDWSGEDRGI